MPNQKHSEHRGGTVLTQLFFLSCFLRDSPPGSMVVVMQKLEAWKESRNEKTQTRDLGKQSGKIRFKAVIKKESPGN